MSGVIAIYDYKQALNTNPQFSYAYNNLGDALAAKRDYTQSIINYGNALKINPKYFEAYYGRGLSNYAVNDHHQRWWLGLLHLEGAWYLSIQTICLESHRHLYLYCAAISHTF